MNNNEKTRLVSIGGGFGRELQDIKKECTNCKIEFINTDPYPEWGSETIIINAKDAIKKYNNEKTLLLASCPHPDFPYLDKIIKARVPFIYLGEKNNQYKDMSDHDKGESVGINGMTIENLPRYYNPSYMEYDDYNILTEERLKNWCTENEYQVVENMTLAGKTMNYHQLDGY
jgi:hypothetical protein